LRLFFLDPFLPGILIIQEIVLLMRLFRSQIRIDLRGLDIGMTREFRDFADGNSSLDQN
jgi:hypothetical protein